MKYTIIPSIIAQSQVELDKRIKKISPLKSELIQLDVMDGEFVPHTSFEFDFTLPKGKKYEAHLMVEDPQPWIYHNIKKIKSFIVHYKAETHLHDLFNDLKKQKKKVGIAINPEVPHEAITQYLHLIDKVLIMTVHPGKYGSNFLKDTLTKINHIRRKNLKINIEVDGGINPDTIKLARAAGANQFVIGSFLQQASNPKSALSQLKKALK